MISYKYFHKKYKQRVKYSERGGHEIGPGLPLPWIGYFGSNTGAQERKSAEDHHHVENDAL